MQISNRIQDTQAAQRERRAWQALTVWVAFIAVNSLINGTIPFALGADLREWSASPTKFALVGSVVYAGLFLVVPLVLIKGWQTVRQPAFFGPLCLAIAAITFSLIFEGINTLAVIVLVYLHWRFDLSEYGFRSRSWKGDALAILLIGSLGAVRLLFRSTPLSFAPSEALWALVTRLFANPGASVENLFYFGFLTERLSQKTGRWLTPFLIGAMYATHEMTNPEYWYEGLNFGLVFIGVSIIAALYLWRRNVIAIWLGDGLGRFISRLF